MYQILRNLMEGEGLRITKVVGDSQPAHFDWLIVLGPPL